jgi:hypothetical protein
MHACMLLHLHCCCMPGNEKRACELVICWLVILTYRQAAARYCKVTSIAAQYRGPREPRVTIARAVGIGGYVLAAAEWPLSSLEQGEIISMAPAIWQCDGKDFRTPVIISRTACEFYSDPIMTRHRQQALCWPNSWGRDGDLWSPRQGVVTDGHRNFQKGIVWQLVATWDRGVPGHNEIWKVDETLWSVDAWPLTGMGRAGPHWTRHITCNI